MVRARVRVRAMDRLQKGAPLCDVVGRVELEAARLEPRLLLVALRLYAAAHRVALEGDRVDVRVESARVRLRPW